MQYIYPLNNSHLCRTLGAECEYKYFFLFFHKYTGSGVLRPVFVCMHARCNADESTSKKRKKLKMCIKTEIYGNVINILPDIDYEDMTVIIANRYINVNLNTA